MKKIFFTILALTFLNSYSQDYDFSANDLRKVMNIISFNPVNNLKGLSSQKLNQFFNMVEADEPMLKQLNIDSWFYCEYKKIDNLETYNYYYKDITRTTYNTYCKEINALMILDGIIKQPK